MLFVDLLIPLILLLTGKHFRDHTPNEISMVCGYRTRRSTRNKDTWLFANQLMGKLWCRWSLPLMLLSVIPMLLVLGKETAVVSAVGGALCLLQLAAVFFSIYKIEQALKKAFDPEGNRRYN